jgi:aspartate carbamoyltransferase catalytic subunit
MMIPESLTTIREISSEAILSYLSLAHSIKLNPNDYATTLKGKTVLQFFAENSTRTRMSFEAATRKLGGLNVAFAAGNSSINKGETLLDTILTIKQYGVDAIVMRHSSGGSPHLVAEVTEKSVINAGDGSHEHPTQALLDCFMLGEHWGIPFQGVSPFRGKTILILGDTLHSRVARSNIHLLGKLGARVILSGPRTLTIKNLELFPKVEVVDFPDLILKEVDAVMALRIQTERQSQGLIPSKEEYRHFWGLTVERARGLKKDAVVLHPGPMNRGVEIDHEIADSDHSLVLKQVENGVFVRMAVLAKLIGAATA